MLVDLTAPLGQYPVNNALMTHMDLYYTGKAIPMESLVTECVLLDAAHSENPVITEEAVGGIEDVGENFSVIIRTGWEKYRESERYDQCPEVDEKLVKALVKKGVRLILVDSPGVRGGARGEIHNRTDQYLSDNNAFAVENLVNTSLLDRRRFTLYCFPLPMSEQNWAPCRVAARLE